MAEGQNVDVKIEDMDKEQKRLSLALIGEMEDNQAGTAAVKDDTAEYLQKHHRPADKASLGTLGEVLRKKLKEKEKK